MPPHPDPLLPQGRRGRKYGRNLRRSQTIKVGTKRAALSPSPSEASGDGNNGRCDRFVPSCRTGTPQRDVRHQLQNMSFATIKVGTSALRCPRRRAQHQATETTDDLPGSFRPAGRGRRSATSATNCKICRSQLSRWGQARCAVPVAERSIRRRKQRTIYEVRSVLSDGDAAARRPPPTAKMDELNLNRLP